MTRQTRRRRVPGMISTRPDLKKHTGQRRHSDGRPNVNPTGPRGLNRRLRSVAPLFPPTSPDSKDLPVPFIKYHLFNTGEKLLSNDFITLVTKMIRIHEDLFLIADTIEYA